MNQITALRFQVENREENTVPSNVPPKPGKTPLAFSMIHPLALTGFPDSLVLPPLNYSETLPLALELLDGVLLYLNANDLKSAARVCKQWHALAIQNLFLPSRENTYQTERYRLHVLGFHFRLLSFPYSITDETLRENAVISMSQGHLCATGFFALSAIRNPTAADILALQILSPRQFSPDLVLLLCSRTLMDSETLSSLNEIGCQIAHDLEDDPTNDSVHLLSAAYERLNRSYLNHIITLVLRKTDYENNISIFRILLPAFTKSHLRQVFEFTLSRMNHCLSSNASTAVKLHQKLAQFMDSLLIYLNLEQRKKLIAHFKKLFKYDSLALYRMAFDLLQKMTGEIDDDDREFFINYLKSILAYNFRGVEGYCIKKPVIQIQLNCKMYGLMNQKMINQKIVNSKMSVIIALHF